MPKKKYRRDEAETRLKHTEQGRVLELDDHQIIVVDLRIGKVVLYYFTTYINGMRGRESPLYTTRSMAYVQGMDWLLDQYSDIDE